MVNFILFRILLLSKGKQNVLFEINKKLVLHDLISTRHSSVVRKDHLWVTGNIVNIDDEFIHFKFGRKTQTIEPDYDETTGDFIEIQGKDTKYINIFYDSTYQILVIEQNFQLASPRTAANYLKKLFNDLIDKSRGKLTTLDAESLAAVHYYEVKTETIIDPHDFIHYIQNAFLISRLRLEFRRPNTWDFGKDFQGPMQRATEYLNGYKTTANIYSLDGLDADATIEAARDAASVGAPVSARLKQTKEASLITKRMDQKHSPAILQDIPIETETDKRLLKNTIREFYGSIRGKRRE
jgi:hypothetical protein